MSLSPHETSTTAAMAQDVLTRTLGLVGGGDPLPVLLLAAGRLVVADQGTADDPAFAPMLDQAVREAVQAFEAPLIEGC